LSTGEKSLTRLLLDLATNLVMLAIVTWQIWRFEQTHDTIHYQWCVILLLLMIYGELDK